jgi:cytochrome P450
MLALEREGGLSHDEVWAQLVGLVFAGHETTTGSLSLLMHTLLQWPDQLQALREDPSLVGNAAYEILRFESPVDPVVRRVHTSWELHGRTFEEGALICPCLAAANRDPREFPDPDRFDVRRRNALRHLGFGGGIHRCLGASLAVLELEIALEMLLERLERFELAGEPQLATDRLFRGFASLPLYVERRD